LIGLSGVAQSFDEPMIKELCKHCAKPIIFALSNPTSKAECSAQQAYQWSEGTCIFASGSPFDPVEYKGKRYVPGQGNNMYIFPGLGFGASLCKAKNVSDAMIISAAITLAHYVSESEIQQGQIYPKLDKIRDISAKIATAVIETAYKEGIAQLPKPESILQFVKNSMYQPEYLLYED